MHFSSECDISSHQRTVQFKLFQIHDTSIQYRELTFVAEYPTKKKKMARIFITGSSDGIGQLIARSLIAQGHKVTLHARNLQRAEVAMAGAPGAEGVLIADLSSITQTKQLASDANKTGVFDTVIHNAGIGYQEGFNKTEDGIAHVFAVNALAPYILTSLMKKPKNLVYLSSGLHTGGDASLKDVTWTSGRRWNGLQAYSDSK